MHILITLADYHGHIIFNAGVKPPGGVPALTCPAVTGLSRIDVDTFPSFEQVYPFLFRFFSPKWSSLAMALTRTLPL